MDQRRLRRAAAAGHPRGVRREAGLKLLLDTHVLLWALEGDLAEESAEVIGERAESVWVSAASVWESQIKAAVGKLRPPPDLVGLIDESGLERLQITFEHAAAAGALPLLHRDPFDRMLVAQARSEGMTLATADEALARYDVPVLAVSRLSR
ncbi:MAG TPA: type II toxin-antitoxin system VapC family toxin [Solirubrobacteraceae bacterium]|nr:type II toxin-antitoxin system VapC family toxin [Solirubrobacteraceae bacterium]